MNDAAYLLMTSGVVQNCPDCREDRIFVITAECDADRCAYACTSCGAAILIDPIVEITLAPSRVA